MAERTSEAVVRRAEPVILAVVSGWEFAALVAHSPHLPTVTALVLRLPKFARRVVACTAAVWLVRHFN